MNIQPEKPKRYYGRVEFLACKDDVLRMLEEGYTMQSIHDVMVRDKKMTMHYRTFCAYVKRYTKTGSANPPPKITNNSPAVPSLPAEKKEPDSVKNTKSKFIRAEDENFAHDSGGRDEDILDKWGPGPEDKA